MCGKLPHVETLSNPDNYSSYFGVVHSCKEGHDVQTNNKFQIVEVPASFSEFSTQVLHLSLWLVESFHSSKKNVTDETILLSTSPFQMGLIFAEFNL